MKDTSLINANDLNAAHLDTDNTFTGSNTFTSITVGPASELAQNPGTTIDESGIRNYVSTPEHCYSIGNGKIMICGNAPTCNIKVPESSLLATYNYILPTASGTLALTKDIIDFKDNKLMGTYTCSLTREATSWLTGDSTNGWYGSYCSPGFLAAGFGNGSPTVTKGTVAIGPGGLYMIGDTANRLKFTLPNKSGTLATTDDIPIKTATLSGTTLSITLS